jgi:hypothetical protein
MVGSVARSSRVTDVAAPVCCELKIGSVAPMTVIVSETAAIFSVKLRSVDAPRLTLTSSFTSFANPLSAAVILYGPPTRIPGMK